MKVFIAGASGLVGGACMRWFREQGWEVKGSYFSYPIDGLEYFNTLEKDSRNFDVAGWNPDAIVHCGALTHVDYCEANIEESYQKTVQSTLTLLDLAQSCNARFVYFSTDYVFDGVDGPYKETDAVNPISIYGKHKLEAEQAVLARNLDALVLRVTNIYGDEPRGKNFVARIVSQAKDGAELKLKLPYDQFAHPTNASDLARAIHLLLRDGKSGIYHLGGTDYMNRVELALRVLKHFPDAKYQLEAVSTESLAQPAPRPLNGGFIRAKFCSEYPEFLFSNIDDYLN